MVQFVQQNRPILEATPERNSLPTGAEIAQQSSVGRPNGKLYDPFIR